MLNLITKNLRKSSHIVFDTEGYSETVGVNNSDKNSKKSFVNKICKIPGFRYFHCLLEIG